MIPKIIHFVFGLSEDFGGKPFSFTHYMAIRSAIDCNPEYRVKYYYKYEPSGIFWEVAKRHVEPVPIEPPTEVFGQRLYHVAHQADVIRLQRLLEEGGVYLDLDTITVRSFNPLLEHEMVMGVQSRGGKSYGLCNAVMLAAPGARFVRRWLDSYATFRSKGHDGYWDEHSVKLPMKLAQQHPDEITILGPDAFFQPSAEPSGILNLFVDNKSFPAAYCHHLWEGLAWNLIKSLDERQVLAVDTTYNILACRFLNADFPYLQALRNSALAKLCTPPIRLNLDAGANSRPGWLNVDSVGATSPDLVFDITQVNWPLPTNSVVEVELSHTLDHIEVNYKTVMQELYRVCQDGAKVYIKVLHPHLGWLGSESTEHYPFEMLDLETCRKGLLSGKAKTPLAIELRVDFELIATQQIPDPEFSRLNQLRILIALGYPFFEEWSHRLRAKLGRETPKISKEEKRLAFLSRYLTNIVCETQVTLRARKRPSVMPVDSTSY